MASKTLLEPVEEWLKDQLVSTANDARWNDLFGDPILQGSTGDVTFNHVLMAGVVFAVIVVTGLWARGSFTDDDREAILPDPALSWRNFYEFSFGYMLNAMKQQMPTEEAKRYFPLIATLTVFILFANVLGLVPGFLPPTQNLNTSFAMAVAVFLSYNFIGFYHHGAAYLKEFASPVGLDELVGEDAGGVVYMIGAVGWMFLTALFVLIETVSHSFRPISLAVRLTGNMGGDHQVLSLFGDLVPLAVPVPFLFLGLLVSIVQTLVFALLSVAYISLSVSGSH